MTSRPSRPRMKDVAAEAGVSVMTVSRVVNGEAGVAPLTAARVAAAVRKLGYQRDDVARQLRRTDRLSQTIGLMVDNVADPFMAAVASATEDVAHRRGNMVLIGSSRADLRREREVIAAFTARRVDGLILTPVAGDHRVLRSAQARGTKIVCVDRVAPGLDVDTVVVDNFGAVRQAVRHLIAHGHRRICYLGDKPEIWTFGERHRGYLAGWTPRASPPIRRSSGTAYGPARTPPGPSPRSSPHPGRPRRSSRATRFSRSACGPCCRPASRSSPSTTSPLPRS